MSSLQSTSDSQKSLNKEITSKVYQKKIKCVFLNQFDPKDIKPYFKLESLLTQIEVSVDVSVFGTDDGLDTDSLTEAILQKLNEKFPGIEAIDLYLYELIYNNVFNKESSSVITKINNPIPTKIANFNLLSSVYVVITKIYGLKRFTEISEVECNFINPEGQEDIITLLLPEFPVPKKKFEQAFSVFFNEEVDATIILDNKQISEITATCINQATITFNKKLGMLLAEPLNIKAILNFLSRFEISTVKPLFKGFFDKDVYQLGEKLFCGYNNQFYHALPIGSKDIRQIFVVGRSGCGKTSTIAQLSRDFPIIYIDLSIWKNFLYVSLPEWMNKPHIVIETKNLIDDQRRITEEVSKKLYSIILAILMYVRRRIADKVPLFEIFLEQLNGSKKTISDIAYMIQDCDFSASCLEEKIRNFVSTFEEKTPIIACDEFQEFKTSREKVIMSYQAISRKQPVNPEMFFPYGHVLLQATSRLYMHSIFSGTKLTFDYAEKVTSANPNITFQRVTNFETCQDPKSFLADLIGLEKKDIEIDDCELAYFKGRYRFVSFIVSALIAELKSLQNQGRLQTDKKELMKKLLKTPEIIQQAKNSVQQYFLGFHENLEIHEVPFLTFALHSSISIDTDILSENLFEVLYKNPTTDFFYEALQKQESFSFSFDELTFRERFLKALPEALNRHYGITLSLVEKKTASASGKFFELIFLESLRKLSEKIHKISELPFFKDSQVALPDWCSSNFTINDVVTHDTKKQDFDFINSFVTRDEAFIEEHIISNLISPSNSCGPDGYLILKCDENLTQPKTNPKTKPKYIMFLFGVKYSMDKINSTKRLENEKTTSLDNLFQKKEDRIPLRQSIIPSNEQINEQKELATELATETEDLNIAQQFRANILEKLKEKVYIIHVCVEFDKQNYDQPFTFYVFDKEIAVFVNSKGFFKLGTFDRETKLIENSYFNGQGTADKSNVVNVKTETKRPRKHDTLFINSDSKKRKLEDSKLNEKKVQGI